MQQNPMQPGSMQQGQMQPGSMQQGQMQPDMSMQSPTSTGTTNEGFNLVSVLYHALEGAQTYARYAEDAGRTDPELAQFFMQSQQEENNRAERAKQLLARRLQISSGVRSS
jgi:hypothetical protein